MARASPRALPFVNGEQKSPGHSRGRGMKKHASCAGEAMQQCTFFSEKEQSGDAGQTVAAGSDAGPVINSDFTHIHSNNLNEIIHFDQFILVSKVSQDVLHDALSKVFGTGRNIRKELEGKVRYGKIYSNSGTDRKRRENYSNSGIDVFCSRYRNKHGWLWLTLPANYEYLSLLASVAKNSNIRFRLHSIELAFDYSFPNVEYNEIKVMLDRLANRLCVVNGRGIRVTSKSGNFQECSDGAINGTKTFYFHPLNQELLKQKGWKVPGKHIASKVKIYAKQLDGVWNIRIEITAKRKALRSLLPVVPKEYQRLTQLCDDHFKFDDFFELKEMDYQAFRGKALNLARKKRRGKMISPRLVRMLNEAEGQPFHEQKYHMAEISKQIKSRRFTANLQQLEKTMTLQQAISTPLTDEDENV